MINNTVFQSESLFKLQQETRAGEVIRRLVEIIDLGLFEEGQQLPSENELANLFGVATVTLREALAHLRQRNIIETRRGRNGGSFICVVKEKPVELLYDRFNRLDIGELDDIGDEQIAVSGMATRLAAKRIKTHELQQLQQAIDALSKADSRRTQRQADARFHIEIASASHSKRLVQSEIRLQAEIGELLWLPEMSPDVELIEQEHQAIYDAIAHRDDKRAGALVESHITRGIKHLIGLKSEMPSLQAAKTLL